VRPPRLPSPPRASAAWSSASTRFTGPDGRLFAGPRTANSSRLTPAATMTFSGFSLRFLLPVAATDARRPSIFRSRSQAGSPRSG
jgi:hypothetical protein